MEITDLEKVKNIINYYKTRGLISSIVDLSTKIGYSDVYIYQVLSGSKNLSTKFIQKLISLDQNINKSYLFSDDVNMLKEDQQLENKKLYEEIDVLKKYINLLEERLEDYKKKK